MESEIIANVTDGGWAALADPFVGGAYATVKGRDPLQPQKPSGWAFCPAQR